MWTISDKTVVITGATNGLGLETAAALGRDAGRVVMIGRNAERLKRAQAVVARRSGRTPVGYLCDFSSLSAVAELARRLRHDLPAIHVLVNNAGAVFARRTLTEDGIEATFAVNHLAPFLLTDLLRPTLEASAPARVVTVASGRHFKGTMVFGDLGFEKGYQVLRAYGRSKLANVLFASELARRLTGTGVTSNSVHPGRVATNIWAGAPTWSKPLIQFGLRWTFIPVEEGAAPVIALVMSPDLVDVTGEYFDRYSAVPPSPVAQDPDVAARLWSESERLVTSFLGP